MRLIFVFCCVVLSPLVFADEPSRPLRVGMFTEFEPMVFKVSDEIQGIEVDLANLVSEALDRPLEVHTYRFEELIPALQAHEVDVVMSGLSVTAERQKIVDFTRPYMKIGQMAIVRVDQASEFGKPNGLQKKGLRFAVHQGSTGEAYVRKTYKDATVIPFGGVESCLQALREKQVDVFVHDSTTSWQLGRSFVNDQLLSLNKFLTRESIAWAVNKDDQDLRSALNLVLEKLKASGKVNDIVSHWLPIAPVNIE